MHKAVKSYIQEHCVAGVSLRPDNRNLFVKQSKTVGGKPVVLTKTIPMWGAKDILSEAEQKLAFEKAMQTAINLKRTMQSKLTNKNFVSFEADSKQKLGNGNLTDTFNAGFDYIWGSNSQKQQENVKAYFTDVQEFFGKDKKLADFDEDEITEFKSWVARKIAERPMNMTGTVSNNSINKRLGVIRSLLKYGLRKRLLDNNDLPNPDKRVKNMGIEDLPRGQTKRKPAFTLDEQEQFISTCPQVLDQEWTDVFTWQFDTGMRYDGEWNNFTVDDIDFGRQTITFWRSKTKKYSIEMPLTDRCFDIAKRRRKLAMTRQDRKIFPLSVHTADSMFERVLKHCGFNTKFTKYATRHTYITALAEENVNPKVTMELAGHSCIETTLTYYTKTSSSILEDAVARIQNRSSKAKKVVKPAEVFDLPVTSRKALK